MNSQITAFLSFVSVSGVMTLFLWLYAYIKRKEIRGARIFMWYMAALSFYIFGYAFELTSDSLAKLKFWTTVSYIGMPFAPVLGLLLILNYVGIRVPVKAAAGMFVIPSITLLMVATNDFHHLYYKSIEYLEGHPPPFVALEVGEWYVVHGVYTFGSMFAALIILLRQWNHMKKAYRPQLITLIGGQLIPMVTAFLYLTGVTPTGLDPVPVVMCITSSMYIWALVSTRMLTVIPIAKDRIFESMREGVLVLDHADRLVDFNAAAARMLPALDASLLGEPVRSFWSRVVGSLLPEEQPLSTLEQDIVCPRGDLTTHYQLRSSPIVLRDGEQAGSLLMLIDITEQKQLQQKLEHQAFFDGLTQIYNRMPFIIKSRELLRASLHAGKPVSVILFDIDYFKRVNDSYGHETGDRIIVHVVDVCRRFLEQGALFARYGGEEFVIALPATTLEQAGELAERMRAALEAEPLIVAGSGAIAVTSSFGAAQANGEHDTLENMLRKADAALYRAKRSGRNRVCVAD